MKLFVITLAILATGHVYADETCGEQDHCCPFVEAMTNPSPDAIIAYWAESDCHECGEYETVCTSDSAPSIRISAEITSYYMQQLAQSGVNPGYLSAFANLGSGQSTKEMLKTQMLAQIGLPIEMVHLVLNNMEFSSDEAANKNAMIKFLASSGSIPAYFIPLLFKSENSEEFYLLSMIESGAIDQLTGLLLLSQSSDNFDKDVIMELIIQSVLGGSGDDLLSGIITPYIPKLPQGIYPGSELYMAHFEGLGVNTCSLHDLRNRFNCGYVGISAADCEFQPYCCYSPVWMTDKQVSDSTEGVIKTATAVPWCYYNVFFVWHDQFFLPVKQIGEFAAPLQCPPLWKYDLGLDGSLASLISGSNSLSQLANAREECGFPGITEFQCAMIRGCCWDAESPKGQIQCFKPKDIPSFNPANIPDAFKPVDGVCNTNVHKIPMLYYLRTPATYPFIFNIYGYDVYQEPSRLDCLTKLGACYEEDDEVVANYPNVPRCYKRTSGTAPVGAIGTVIARTGEGDGNPVDQEQWPPATPPATTGQPETTSSETKSSEGEE